MNSDLDYLVGKGLVESHSFTNGDEHLYAYYDLLAHSKELRLASNITQMDMADKLKIGQDKISNYEKGKIPPRLDVYLKYLDLLGYTLKIVKKDSGDK